MEEQELADYIRKHGVEATAKAVSSLDVGRLLTDPEPDQVALLPWRVKTSPGAVLFFRLAADGTVAAGGQVLWVNVPDSEAGPYLALADRNADPVLVLTATDVSR